MISGKSLPKQHWLRYGDDGDRKAAVGCWLPGDAASIADDNEPLERTAGEANKGGDSSPGKEKVTMSD